jgi:hypothetical protein
VAVAEEVEEVGAAGKDANKRFQVSGFRRQEEEENDARKRIQRAKRKITLV